MKKLFKREEGFTIIEVVLVLAIAGLIFLVVFLALPQLQRSRRDTQRRSDVGRALTSLETYASNNNGQYPQNQTDVTDVAANYLRADNSVFSDPSGGDYDLLYITTAATVPDPDGSSGPEMLVVGGSNCENTNNNTRDVSVKVFLEEGGTYCQDNR